MRSKTKQGLLIVICTGAALSSTGCSSLVGEGMFVGDKGRILISADAEGMEAFNDLVVGSITTGKASPDTPVEHYDLRRRQTVGKFTRQSFTRKEGEK